MLVLAELKSQGGTWMDFGERLKAARRSRQNSPLNKSRELIQIYFDEKDQFTASCTRDSHYPGSTSIAKRPKMAD